MATGLATGIEDFSGNINTSFTGSGIPYSGQSCVHNDISKLVEALTLAQADFSPLLKDTENPYFKSKYADLAAVISATLPALIKHGLTVIQLTGTDFLNKAATINTILAHKSGQSISSFLSVPTGAKFDAQSLGAALTYGKRYAYQAIVGVAADIDDDGNSIATGFPPAEPGAKPKYEPKPGKPKGGFVPAKNLPDAPPAPNYEPVKWGKSPESGQVTAETSSQKYHFTPKGPVAVDETGVPKAQIPNLKPNTNENAKAMFEDHEPTKEEKDEFKKKARLYVQEILPQLGVENPAETLKKFVENLTGVSDTKKLSYNQWTEVLLALDKASMDGKLKEVVEG